MKILFYGTHLKHYYLAKWLRQKGHECTLVLPDYKERNMPEASNPGLKGNYPDWIIEPYENRFAPLRIILRYLSRLTLMPFCLQPLINYFEITPSCKIRRLVKSHDLVFTSGSDNLLKSFKFSRPIVFRSLGNDMSIVPFRCRNLQTEFLSYYFRKNLRIVKILIAYQQDTYWSARFLGVNDRLRYFSVPTDIYELKKCLNADLYRRLEQKYRGHDWLIVMPARKNMDSSKPDYKGAEKALRAIARAKSNLGNFKCIATDLGHHVSEFRQLTSSLGLAQEFDFIEPQLLSNLMAYIAQENAIVINDVGFSKSHLTGLARETISLSGLLVDSVDPSSKEFVQLYGNEKLPLYTAASESEIYSQILRIADSSTTERNNKRASVGQWAQDHLHWENQIPVLESILEEAIAAARQ